MLMGCSGRRRPKTSTLLSWNFISILPTHCAETSTIPFIISAIQSSIEARVEWSGKILFFFIGGKIIVVVFIHTLAQKNNQLSHPLDYAFFCFFFNSPTADVISVRSRVVGFLRSAQEKSCEIINEMFLMAASQKFIYLYNLTWYIMSPTTQCGQTAAAKKKREKVSLPWGMTVLRHIQQRGERY